MFPTRIVPNSVPQSSVSPRRMTRAQITRRAAPASTLSEENKKLAVEALDILGYEGLALHGANLLGEVLRCLEIEILDANEVEKYMASITGDRKWDWIPLNEYSANVWSQNQTRIYSAPIPQFVLRKAIQIRRTLPNVTFFVRTAFGDPDPFLWAGVRHFDSYYIEVWDEPKFEEESA